MYVFIVLYLSVLLFYITGSPFVRKRSKSEGNFDDMMAPFHDVDDDGQLSFFGGDNDTLIDMMGTPVNATQSSSKNAPMTRPLTQFLSPTQHLKSSPCLPREITTYQAPNQVTHASSNSSYSTHPTPVHTLSIPPYQHPPQQPYHQPQQQPYHQHQHHQMHHPTLQQAHPPQQYQAMPQHAPPEPAYSAAFPSHARSLHPSYAQEPRRVTLSPPRPPHDGYPHHHGPPPQVPYQAAQQPSYMAPPAPVYSNPHASVSMERRISYSTSPGPNQQPYVQSVHQQVQYSSQQAPPPQAPPSHYHQHGQGSYQGPQARPPGPPANNYPYRYY